MSAYIKELRFSEPFCTDVSHDCARLSVVLDLAGGQPDARSAMSRPTPISADTIHQMNFAPAHSPVWACSDNTRYFRVISFTFDDRSIASLLDEDLRIDSAFHRPRLMFFDQQLFHLAKLFEHECVSDRPTEPLYGDTLSLALLLRFVGFDVAQAESAHGRRGLAAQQLQRVTDYLRSDLSRSVSIRELANTNNLSRAYFIRAFKQSTGLTPHQWLLRERIRKAKEYLLEAGLPISEIALLLGFSDQAHFTRVFSRRAGASPAARRRQRLD